MIVSLNIGIPIYIYIFILLFILISICYLNYKAIKLLIHVIKIEKNYNKEYKYLNNIP